MANKLIQPHLVNGSFGDPMVFCSLAYVGRAFAFDMGGNFALANRDLQKIDAVYLSHAHIDHLFGFENFLRANVKQDRRIEIFGPPGIQKNIFGKLQGFTWNLTQGYGLEFAVHEILPGKLVSYAMKSREKFRLRKTASKKLLGKSLSKIHQNEHYIVESIALDHRIVSQAYAVTENMSVSINQEALEKAGWIAGAWLQTLKDLAIKGRGDNQTLEVPLTNHLNNPTGEKSVEKIKVSKLKKMLIVPRQPQRIVYVSDTILHKENRRKILKLAANADLFFCESTFMHADIDKAEETFHLTARQTGDLAREAGVKRLIIFHFSKKYLTDPQPLIQEASEAFGKTVEAYLHV